MFILTSMFITEKIFAYNTYVVMKFKLSFYLLEWVWWDFMWYYLFPLILPFLVVKKRYATRSLSFSSCNITTFAILDKPRQGVALCFPIYIKLNFQLIKHVFAVLRGAVSKWEKNDFCARSSQERVEEATDRIWEFLTGLIQILDGFGRACVDLLISGSLRELMTGFEYPLKEICQPLTEFGRNWQFWECFDNI